MASPFYSPFRRPPMNPFGSMMGFGMGPNLFSGGMPFYNPFPRMPMYGGGLGGFGGFGGMGGGFNPFGSQFGGMGGGFNPFMMSPPPMQRFPRYDSLIPMQSQMPSQSLQDLPYQPKRPEMTSIEESSPSVGQTTGLPEGYSFNMPDGGIYSGVMPDTGMRYAYGPQGDRIQVPRTSPVGASPESLMSSIRDQRPPSIEQMPQPVEQMPQPIGQEPLPIGQEPQPMMPPTPPRGNSMPPGFIPPPADSLNTMAFVDYYNPTTGETWSAPSGGYTAPPGWELDNRNRFSIEQPMMPPTPSFTPFDPSGLQARIGDLEGRQMFDPSGLKSRIDALENRQMPTSTPFDPSGLQSQISALQNRQMPTFTPFDPTGLQSQIDALQNRQMPMFDSSGLQSRLNALEGRVQKTGNLNMTDIEALIEQRLSDSLRNMDLSSRNPGVNSITTNPNLIKEIQKDLPPPRKRYNDRLFIGQGGPYDI